MFRGYNQGAITGTGVVPYVLPIPATICSASSVLNNEGYHILDTYLGGGTNVEIGTIEMNYK